MKFLAILCQILTNFCQSLWGNYNQLHHRAVFKWLSKVITWLRFLRLVIGLKESRQFFNQWEAIPKPIAPCTRHFSRALSELHVIARNCVWFIALSVPVVIGRTNCFGFGFSTIIWKPLYQWIICIYELTHRVLRFDFFFLTNIVIILSVSSL